MPAEPGGEVDAVERRVGGVELLQGERGPADGGALGEGEVRIRGEAAREVQRYGQVVAADPAEPGAAGVRDVEDGDVEAVLEGGEAGAADPVEEPAVGGAAAQVDVLAVVDGQVAPAEGEGEAAEPGPAFEQRDADAALGEPERGGDTGEPTPDDDGPGLRAPAGAGGRRGTGTGPGAGDGPGGRERRARTGAGGRSGIRARRGGPLGRFVVHAASVRVVVAVGFGGASGRDAGAVPGVARGAGAQGRIRRAS
ncbi:hypothetical protein GCM10010275_53030 [Streptomyces litmocidini]|nr:hypothetical protein GCM10010275_53030 [Streptomyces litmocidini]